MKTGNTCGIDPAILLAYTPQWSPVMKTGNTRSVYCRIYQHYDGSQWSPVMKTGNTG